MAPLDGSDAAPAAHRWSRERAWSLRGAGVGAALFVLNALAVAVGSGASGVTVGVVVLFGFYGAGWVLAGAVAGLLLALLVRPRQMAP